MKLRFNAVCHRSHILASIHLLGDRLPASGEALTPGLACALPDSKRRVEGRS